MTNLKRKHFLKIFKTVNINKKSILEIKFNKQKCRKLRVYANFR